MQQLFKVPLIFLFVSACLGLLLRFQLFAPIPGIVYSNILHGHSHVMFLGWVFNVLILAFTSEYAMPTKFKWLFWFLQCCVVGMLLSFPFQGYGSISIAFSTLHTLGAMVFVVMFLRAVNGISLVSLIYVRAALLFFALSSIGPFVVGYLKANELAHTDLYRNAIYFYLHFQYNGFFLFGVLGLFVKLIESNLSASQLRNLKMDGYIMMIACIPAYFLSTLWAQPGIAFNFIGAVAALMQLAALILFLQATLRHARQMALVRDTRLVLTLSLCSLLLKSILQLLSAHPAAAAFANEFRAIVIAYLHLVLLGFISLFLVGWMTLKGIIQSPTRVSVRLIIVGFIISELILVLSPWNSSIIFVQTSILNEVVFFGSIAMVLGIGLLAFGHRNQR